MQYTSLVMAKELSIDNIRMMVRAHTIRELPRAFTDMVFEIRLDGSASAGEVERVAREASAYCFVENTLARAIPLTTEVFLNGKSVVTLSRTPDPAPQKSGVD